MSYYGPVDESGHRARYESEEDARNRKMNESSDEDYGIVAYAANGSDFPQYRDHSTGNLDALLGVSDNYRVNTTGKMREIRRHEWRFDETSTVNDPPTLPDGTMVGLRIVYMDDDGVYHSPVRGDAWEDGRMGNAWAANPSHPNCHKILDAYARDVSEKLGREPLQAVVSLSGKVQLLSNGGVKAEEVEILYVENYF